MVAEPKEKPKRTNRSTRISDLEWAAVRIDNGVDMDRVAGDLGMTRALLEQRLDESGHVALDSLARDNEDVIALPVVTKRDIIRWTIFRLNEHEYDVIAKSAGYPMPHVRRQVRRFSRSLGIRLPEWEEKRKADSRRKARARAKGKGKGKGQ